MRYTARRFDIELETYDYRARQYDPKIGRFVQRDPLGMIDGTNLYSYTNSAPLAKNDPSGNNSRTEHHHSNPLGWDSLKDGYNNSTYPREPLEFIFDTLSNNSLGTAHSIISNIEPAIPNLSTFDKYTSNLEILGRNRITRLLGQKGYEFSNKFDDALRYPGKYNDKFPTKFPAQLSNFFNAKWVSKYGSVNKLSAWLGPVGMYSHYNDIVNPEQESDVVFGSAGFSSATIGTVGLVGTGLSAIGMTTLAKPLLFMASKLNPIGLVAGAFAGGGLFGQYLDDKTGWSDTLGTRAKTHRKMCGSGYFCAGIGAASTLPVASDVGNAIGWSGARLTLGFTDDNYTYAPWNAGWWPGN